MSRVLHKIALLFTAVLFLAACAAGSSGTAPKTRKADFKPADDIRVSGQDALTGQKRVAIVAFNVGFHQSKDISIENDTGLFKKTKDKETAVVRLKGVSDNVMRDITADAYRDFIKALEAQGYEIVRYADIRTLPDFSKIARQSSPATVGAVRYMSPPDMDLIFYTKAAAATRQLARQGDVSLIAVQYMMDFVPSTDDEGKQTLSLASGSGVRFFSREEDNACKAPCLATLRLTRDLRTTDNLGEIAQDEAPNKSVLNKASDVIGALRGRSKADSYTIKVRTAQYKNNALDLTAQANKKMAENMAGHGVIR